MPMEIRQSGLRSSLVLIVRPTLDDVHPRHGNIHPSQTVKKCQRVQVQRQSLHRPRLSLRVRLSGCTDSVLSPPAFVWGLQYSLQTLQIERGPVGCSTRHIWQSAPRKIMDLKDYCVICASKTIHGWIMVSSGACELLEAYLGVCRGQWRIMSGKFIEVGGTSSPMDDCNPCPTCHGVRTRARFWPKLNVVLNDETMDDLKSRANRISIGSSQRSEMTMFASEGFPVKRRMM